MRTILAVVLLFPILSLAEDIKMKDGTIISGSFGKFSPETVEVKSEKGTLVVPVEKIDADVCREKLPQSAKAFRVRALDQDAKLIQKVKTGLDEIVKAQANEPDWKKIAANLTDENLELRRRLGEVPENEVSDAITEIRKRAAEKYPNDYQMQAWEVDHETEAYFRLHPMAKTSLYKARMGLEPKQNFLQRSLSKGSSLDHK